MGNTNAKRVFFYGLAILDCVLVANVLLSTIRFFA